MQSTTKSAKVCVICAWQGGQRGLLSSWKPDTPLGWAQSLPSHLLMKEATHSAFCRIFQGNCRHCGNSICFTAFIWALPKITWDLCWRFFQNWSQQGMWMQGLSCLVRNTWLGAQPTRERRIARKSPKSTWIGHQQLCIQLLVGIKVTFQRACFSSAKPGGVQKVEAGTTKCFG